MNQRKLLQITTDFPKRDLNSETLDPRLSLLLNWQTIHGCAFGKIHFAKCTNTFCHLNKYIFPFGEIHFAKCTNTFCVCHQENNNLQFREFGSKTLVAAWLAKQSSMAVHCQICQKQSSLHFRVFSYKCFPLDLEEVADDDQTV